MHWKMIGNTFTFEGYEVEWHGVECRWRAAFCPPYLMRPRQTLGSMYASFQEAMDACCVIQETRPACTRGLPAAKMTCDPTSSVSQDIT